MPRPASTFAPVLAPCIARVPEQIAPALEARAGASDDRRSHRSEDELYRYAPDKVERAPGFGRISTRHRARDGLPCVLHRPRRGEAACPASMKTTWPRPTRTIAPSTARARVRRVCGMRLWTEYCVGRTAMPTAVSSLAIAYIIGASASRGDLRESGYASSMRRKLYEALQRALLVVAADVAGRANTRKRPRSICSALQQRGCDTDSSYRCSSSAAAAATTRRT